MVILTQSMSGNRVTGGPSEGPRDDQYIRYMLPKLNLFLNFWIKNKYE